MRKKIVAGNWKLNNNQQEEILDLCWDKPYGFVFIDVNAPRHKRYHSNFDSIIID